MLKIVKTTMREFPKKWQALMDDLEKSGFRTTEATANLLAENLRLTASPFQDTGRLEESIRAEKLDKDSWAVHMIFYAYWLDTGHIVKFDGFVPPTGLANWAWRKFGTKAPFVLLSLKRQGFVRPHPFIENAVNMTYGEMNGIAREELGKVKI